MPHSVSVILVLLLLLVPVGGLFFLAWQSTGMNPESVGPDRFSEGPSKPNWVSSTTRETARRIEPLSFSGDSGIAWKKVQEAVEELGGTTLVTSEPGYVHFECRTPVFGFVDDLELFLNSDQQQIEVRSASRAGHSDLGANRKRVETLRSLFRAKR